MFKKRYLFFAIIVCLFVISTVNAEEINNETISYESSLMTDSVSEYDLSMSLSDAEIQGSADNGTFTDLQEKINNADAGSTITLENDYKYDSGFSTEGISINKTLTINGNGYVIDASGQSRIFFINSTKVTLNNILFKNGNTTDNGGAIYWYGADGTVNDCNFTNNMATLRAGAVYWSGFNGTINNSNFINNTARKYSGGAIQWDYNSTNGTVNNCNFINNTGTQKGGAVYWYEINGKMTNCNFTNNTSINGGAIFWDNNALNGAVDNSSFINNTGDDGGAIYWYGAHGRMTNCNFTNNKGINGGAINWQRTYGLTNNCNFTNNIATNGGAIYWEGTNGTENNCNFINNTAESNGGAVYWFGANGTISYSNFINNNATANGGALYFNDAASLNNCALVNNIAPSGSEIYIYNSNPDLNYNWWGSNNPNWANLINGSYVLSVYAVLNVTADPSEIDVGNKSAIKTEFDWNGTNDIATSSLPKRNVTLSSKGGSLSKTEGAVGLTSEFSATAGGTYEITATVDNEEIELTINVNTVGIPTSVSVNNATLNLFVDGTFTIVANTTPADLNFTYVLDDSGVYNVTDDGLVTALKEGTGSILVKVTGNAGYAENSTTIAVTVSKIPTDIIIANSTLDVKVLNFTSTGANLTPSEAGNLTYNSSNSSVVMAEYGIIIPVGPGNATITVSFAGNDKYAAAENKTITVTVSLNDVSVSVNNSTLDLKTGDTFAINATTVPSIAKLFNVTYNSSDESVVTVDKNGTVTAIGEGNATITVGVGDGRVFAKNSTNITVTVSLKDASVVAEDMELKVGENGTISYTTVPDGLNVTYIVDNSGVVSVDENGIVTALKGGKAVITVKIAPNGVYAENSTEITVSVGKKPVVLSADTLEMYVGDPSQFSANLTDKDGNPIAGKGIKLKIVGKEYTAIIVF